MKCFQYYKLLFVLSMVVVASDVHGQTLFARPDTTPDYPSYAHIEACWSAAIRITIDDGRQHDTIWMDTIEEWREPHKEKVGEEEWRRRRPESAINAMNVCLKKFDPDTATFLSPFSALRIVKFLLIAHRDQEAHTFAERALDSLRRKSEQEYKFMLAKLINEYGYAQPVRYDEAQQYYARFLAARNEDDSLYYAIDAALILGELANRVKDTSARDKAWQLALALNDSIPEDERLKMPMGNQRLIWLASIAVDLTKDVALDSLAISNVAYELWAANTVKRRVYGGELVTRDEMEKEVEAKKMKALQGAHYYVASTVTSNPTSPDTATQGVPTYTSTGAVPHEALPIKHTINYLAGMSTLCHTETEARSKAELVAKPPNGCLDWATKIRNLKHEFPDIEIIGLSSTYGTVGQLGPLTPEENADTLAKLFLGFHRLPVRLVVENTEFWHLADPDGRRIDSETPNSVAMGCPIWSNKCVTMVDKDGYKIMPYSDDFEWFKRFYDILKNRPSK